MIGVNHGRPRLMVALSIVLAVLIGTACTGGEEANEDWFPIVCDALTDYNASVVTFVEESQAMSADFETFVETDATVMMARLADDAVEFQDVVAAVEVRVPDEDREIYLWFRDRIFTSTAGAQQMVDVLTANELSFEALEVTTADMVSTLAGPGGLALSGVPEQVDPALLETMAETRQETLDAMGSCEAFVQPYAGLDATSVFPFPLAELPAGEPGDPWDEIVAATASGSLRPDGLPAIVAEDLVGPGWELRAEEDSGLTEGPLDALVELMSSVCSVLVRSDEPPITENPEPINWRLVEITRPEVDPGTIIVAVEEYADTAQAREALTVVRRAMGCFEGMGLQPAPWDVSATPGADMFGLTVDNAGVTALPVTPGLPAYDEAPAGRSEMVWIQRSRYVVSLTTDPYGLGVGATPEVAALLLERMSDDG